MKSGAYRNLGEGVYVYLSFVSSRLKQFFLLMFATVGGRIGVTLKSVKKPAPLPAEWIFYARIFIMRVSPLCREWAEYNTFRGNRSTRVFSCFLTPGAP